MVRKIYDVQKINPTDFTKLVKDDMNQIGMNLNEDEISKIPKQRCKKIYNQAFTYLGIRNDFDGLYSDKMRRHRHSAECVNM